MNIALWISLGLLLISILLSHAIKDQRAALAFTRLSICAIIGYLAGIAP